MNELPETKIDRRQFRALFRVALKTDLRGATNPMNTGGAKRFRIPPIFGVLLIYAFTGAMLAGMSFFMKNPFNAACLVFTTMAMLLALTVLLEFSSLILSPDDYQIVAPRPIGSKTFFAVKLVHLLAYVNTLGLFIYLPPAVSASFANHNFWLLLSFFAAGLLFATTVGMAFVVFYALILKIVNRESMQRILGYSQLVMISLFYFGYFAVPRLIGREALAQVGSYSSPWIYLVPSAWFAAIAKLPAGNLTLFDAGAGLLAILLCCLAFRAGMSHLSLGYAQTLSNIVSQQDEAAFAGEKGIFARFIRTVSSGEDRAVWRLIYKQFKYDNRFKTSILTVLPLTALYAYLGISDGGTVADPFRASLAAGPMKATFLLYISAALLPFMVAMGTINSESYRAAWIFYTSPSDRTRMVLSSARFALVFFCVPYTLILLGLFAWFFGSFVHAFLHCLIIYALLMILTKVMVLFHPRFPFSRTVKKGQNLVALMVITWIVIALMLVPMMVVSNFGYGGYVGYLVFLFCALAVNSVIYRVIKRTVPGRVKKLEFEL